MPKMTAIEAAVHVLEKEGVSVCFGVPGAAINPFYSALQRNGRIGHILARHVEALAQPYEAGALLAQVGREGNDDDEDGGGTGQTSHRKIRLTGTSRNAHSVSGQLSIALTEETQRRHEHEI